MNNEQEIPVCCYCGTVDNLTYEPDPFYEEVCGDDECVWMCESCRVASAMEI